MRKLVSVITLLLILGISILQCVDITPVVAADLNTRLSPNIVTRLISSSGGVDTYRATISSRPETLADLKTPITCTWTKVIGADGVSIYKTDANTYLARVTGTRVSIEYSSRTAAWDPTVYIGDTKLSLQTGPVVIGDIQNTNYKSNTIRWTYSGTVGGWFFGLFGKKTITVTRYLRQIEGGLQETYILDKYPGNSITIKQGYLEEEGFGNITEVFACDLDGNILEVTTSGDSKSVSSNQLKDASYPVTIDPTFEGSTADTWLSKTGAYAASYSSVRTSATAANALNGQVPIWVGQMSSNYNQEGYGTYYGIHRSSLYFNTSTLPDDAIIQSAIIDLNCYLLWNTNPFSVVAQTGSSGHPAQPAVVADYNYTYYSGNGGSLSSTNIVQNQYNSLVLNDLGRTWVSTTGYSTFMLRSDKDINGTAPNVITNTSVEERVGFWSSEYGLGYWPKLTVEYTIPVVIPAITTNDASEVGETSATLNGYVTSDGGQSCSVGFMYGTTTPPASATPAYSGYVTNQYFSYTQIGLARGTLYYARGYGTNTAGTGYSSTIKTLLTKPAVPYGVTITPGDTQNGLEWTKGNGASKTLVLRKTGSYSENTTDGTQVYFSTGSSCSDTGLTNGTTYYYSLWSEVTSGSLQQYSTTALQGYGKPYVLSKGTVTTTEASGVGDTTATLNGDLTSLGGYADVDVYFEYGESTEYGSNTAGVEKTTQGAFDDDISGLDASTLYHFRAVVSNGSGDAYGADKTFTTGAGSAPTMTTDNATGVGMFQATLNGKVTADGGTATTVWFQWGLTLDYGHTTDTAVGLYTGEAAYVSITGLTYSTTYHYRIVGQNTAGITYGGDKSFSTDAPVSPQVTTRAASGIGATVATLWGRLDYDGGTPSDVYFKWGTASDNLSETTSTLTDYYTGQDFSIYLTDFTTGSTCYFQAYAENPTDTDSGDVLSFTTVFTEPTGFQAKALGSTSIGLSWGKVGDATGVYMKRGSYPVDRLDGTQVYFGSGTGTTVASLTSGATYYFRAWSWRSGGTWSDDYIEDVATTGAYSPTGEEPETPGDKIIKTPSDSGDWWLTPTGDGLIEFPFHTTIENAATAVGMPTAGMWALIGVLIIVMVGMVAGILVNGHLLILGGIIVITAGFCSTMGLLPLWVAILLGLAYIGYGLATKNA